jgi:hypothetical protein
MYEGEITYCALADTSVRTSLVRTASCVEPEPEGPLDGYRPSTPLPRDYPDDYENLR